MKETCTISNFPENSKVVDWLFEILESYSNSQRAEFLFFISGSYKVPFSGFKNNPLTITAQNYNDIESLPIGHTCFYELEIPNYPTKEILKNKLFLALNEGNKGFYIF